MRLGLKPWAVLEELGGGYKVPTCDGYEGQREFRLRAASSMSARPSCRGVICIMSAGTIVRKSLVWKEKGYVENKSMLRG